MNVSTQAGTRSSYARDMITHSGWFFSSTAGSSFGSLTSWIIVSLSERVRIRFSISRNNRDAVARTIRCSDIGQPSSRQVNCVSEYHSWVRKAIGQVIEFGYRSRYICKGRNGGQHFDSSIHKREIRSGLSAAAHVQFFQNIVNMSLY